MTGLPLLVNPQGLTINRPCSVASRTKHSEGSGAVETRGGSLEKVLVRVNAERVEDKGMGTLAKVTNAKHFLPTTLDFAVAKAWRMDPRSSVWWGGAPEETIALVASLLLSQPSSQKAQPRRHQPEVLDNALSCNVAPNGICE